MATAIHSAPTIACPTSLSQSSLAALERQLDTFLMASPQAIIFDVSTVDAAESAGLEWLCSVHARLTSQSIQMVLRNPSPVMRDILLATRLDSRFQFEGGNKSA